MGNKSQQLMATAAMAAMMGHSLDPARPLLRAHTPHKKGVIITPSGG